jgi:serine/threonine protein kinase
MMATNNEQLELTNSSILESVTSNVSNILESPVPDGITATPDDYVILQSIGVGYYGTANILLARHKPTRLVLVIRQIDLEALNNDKLEEIEHEMQLSNMLIHPNVASYYCSFVSGPMLWAVQSLMHYGSCADLMHSAKQFNNGFSENVIAIILRDVVKGLHYLHSLGFVHR